MYKYRCPFLTRDLVFIISTQHSLPTSVVFLTTHDTLLTGQRTFFVAMVSNAVDTLIFIAQCSECQRGEKFKQARTNGSHVGLKPVFASQPKLRIICLHVLRQM